MKKKQIGYFIIASAIIWAFVIISCALFLRGTPYKEEINSIIGGGAGLHLILIWIPLQRTFKKSR